MVPFWTDRSEWHTPEATTFTLHSPGPGGAISMSSWTWTSSPTPFSTAAVTMVPPGSVDPPSVPPAPQGSQTSLSVLALGCLHRVPEHDGRCEDEGPDDEAPDDRGADPAVEAGGEADDEQDHCGEEQAVPEPL